MKISMKLGMAALLVALIGAPRVFAQDQNEERAAPRSEAEAQPTEKGVNLAISNLAIRPAAGAIFFEGEQRFTGGVFVDLTFLSSEYARVGPATGALYSSLGGGTDFFSGISTSNDNYIFQIPANLKVTVMPEASKRLQVGVHGGANIVRTNNATAANAPFGDTADQLAGGETSSWDVRPNVGADIDWALGKSVDLSLRPDVTVLPDFNMVTTTLALAMKI